ncbi:alpha/beta-hydrolase [Amylocystis lapponica]|nr:alpha/beta-hydrolase [Amylocystis lapponica]
MVAFALLVSALVLVSSSWAFPVGTQRSPLQNLPFVPTGLFCNIPFPLIQEALCPRQTTSSPVVMTPLGPAQGAADTTGATRFVVRYGNADRWQESTVVSSWEFPTGASNASGLPLMCPQLNADDSTFSEDCLAMILYVPTSIMGMVDAPTLMWLHGGSFLTGSATGPGLDGSALAAATNSIVAVVQYRLGALGFMAPDGTTNLAVKDVVTALSFLQKIAPSFGGDASKITLAGQSSGANMIRAILAAPSVSSMFQSAILQSDPMDYGFLNTTTQGTLLNYFNSQISCGSSDSTCLASLSVDDILNAQQNLTNNAASLDPAAGSAEPIRPVRDNELIMNPLDLTAPFPTMSKPILVTTVLDEAALTIYSIFSDPIGQSTYDAVVSETFGQPRTQRLLSNTLYTAPPTPNDGAVQDARPQLQVLGTDQVWRCATWTFARNWAQSGGSAYVGVYTLGATYPGNSDVAYCTQAGVVCHQDDIEIVFGTVPSPTAAQAALVTEMQARYSAFLHSGDPNAAGYPTWVPTSGSNVTALQFGSAGEYAAGACTVDYWGDYIEYDYQVYDI